MTKTSGWLQLEDKGRDFPFYNAIPVGLTPNQWLLLICAVAAGLAALIGFSPWFTGDVAAFIPAALFVLIPLGTLYLLSGHQLQALFYKVGWRELRLMLGFALLNLLVTFSVALLVENFWTTESNPAVVQLKEASSYQQVLFYLRTFIQLIGEELFTILPFLALIWLLTSCFQWPRGQAIFAAWILTAILFALIHLPTYHWNLLQCLVIIGSARLVLTLAYIKTKNLWVCSGAHIINDWTLFTLAIVGQKVAVS
ncbi:MAG: CPBP family intramembrane metalloprotease [Gammaproteobacteria bacterium]|nr:CPBP family intramembrane metalloprotease [Gammaproteobacteria bacterium]